jgi:hypothetical protein
VSFNPIQGIIDILVGLSRLVIVPLINLGRRGGLFTKLLALLIPNFALALAIYAFALSGSKHEITRFGGRCLWAGLGIGIILPPLNLVIGGLMLLEKLPSTARDVRQRHRQWGKAFLLAGLLLSLLAFPSCMAMYELEGKLPSARYV